MRPWRRPCSVLGDMGTESGVHTLPRLIWGDTEAAFVPPFAEESKRHGRALSAISFWCPKVGGRSLWRPSGLGPLLRLSVEYYLLSLLSTWQGNLKSTTHCAAKADICGVGGRWRLPHGGQGWGQVPKPNTWHLGSCPLRPDPAKLRQSYGAGKWQHFSSNSLPELGKTPLSLLFSSCFTHGITAISHKKGIALPLLPVTLPLIFIFIYNSLCINIEF